MAADRFWNWIAGWYDRQSHGDESFTRTVERFAKYLKADDTVLDFACGTGVVAFKVAPHVERVVGIDTSTRMIDLARERARRGGFENVEFRRQTLFDRTLERQAYDCLVAFNILHLLEDARTALERTVELVRPGGLIVSSTPCLRDGKPWIRAAVPVFRAIGLLSYLEALRVSDLKTLHTESGIDVLEHEVRGGAIPLCFIVGRRKP